MPFITEEVKPPVEEEVPWPSPLVRQLIATTNSKQLVRTRQHHPLPAHTGTATDALRIAPRAPSEVDTLKDVAKSKSPTRKTSRSKTIGLGITPAQLIAIAIGAGLFTIILTALVMWWILRG